MRNLSIFVAKSHHFFAQMQRVAEDPCAWTICHFLTDQLITSGQCLLNVLPSRRARRDETRQTPEKPFSLVSVSLTPLSQSFPLSGWAAAGFQTN